MQTLIPSFNFHNENPFLSFVRFDLFFGRFGNCSEWQHYSMFPYIVKSHHTNLYNSLEKKRGKENEILSTKVDPDRHYYIILKNTTSNRCKNWCYTWHKEKFRLISASFYDLRFRSQNEKSLLDSILHIDRIRNVVKVILL